MAATATGAAARLAPSRVEGRVVAARWLKRVLPGLAVALVILWAVSLRVGTLNDPPTDFHVSRQYTGVLLAHSFYVDLSPRSSHQERVIAALDRPPLIEPPVLESATAA